MGGSTSVLFPCEGSNACSASDGSDEDDGKDKLYIYTCIGNLCVRIEHWHIVPCGLVVVKAGEFHLLRSPHSMGKWVPCLSPLFYFSSLN